MLERRYRCLREGLAQGGFWRFFSVAQILGSLELLEMEGAFLAAAEVAARFTFCMCV
jgi:hypothetical protein